MTEFTHIKRPRAHTSDKSLVLSDSIDENSVWNHPSIYATVTVPIVCDCKPRHSCFKNKSTQFPEEKLKEYPPLRLLDLVPIPRPIFIEVKEVKEVKLLSTVTEENLFVDKPGKIVKEVSLDAPRLSLVKLSEEKSVEKDFEETIQQKLFFKNCFKIYYIFIIFLF